MTTIKLDDNGDIDITNNKFSLIDGKEYVQQTLLTKLRTFRGEAFLDVEFGVPYFQEILEKDTPLSRVESIFKEQILSTSGVVELLKFDLSYIGSTREATLSFTVRCLDGIISISEVIS